MKLLIMFMVLTFSFSVYAQSQSCEMTSGVNKTQIKLISNPQGVLVQLAEEEPDQCVLEISRNFDLLARCGNEDEATYFGIKGSSGRVFEGSTTIAQLKRCKRF